MYILRNKSWATITKYISDNEESIYKKLSRGNKLRINVDLNKVHWEIDLNGKRCHIIVNLEVKTTAEIF